MSLASNALVTLDEAKQELRVGSASDNDSWIESIIKRISDAIEAYADQDFVFVPDAEIGNEASIVASVTYGTGTLTVIQPTTPRSLIITLTGTLTGTITVTGTAPDGITIQEVFTAADALVQYGLRAFKTITSAVVTSGSGTGTIKIGTAQPITEYHSVKGYADNMKGASVLYTRRNPVADIIEVNEDPGRVFAAGTALTDIGTSPSFIYSRGEGRITKTGGTLPGAQSLFIDYPEDYYFRYSNLLPRWTSVPRAIRVLYTGGYRLLKDRSNLPGDLKTVALNVISRAYRTAERKSHGQGSISTGVGTASTYIKTVLFTDEEVGIIEGYHTRSRSYEEA